MAKPYSNDLRRRVIEAAQDGASIAETVEQLGISVSSVVRFRRLYRETGSIRPAKFGGYKSYALAAHEERVRQLVEEQHIALGDERHSGKGEGEGRAVINLPLSASFATAL